MFFCKLSEFLSIQIVFNMILIERLIKNRKYMYIYLFLSVQKLRSIWKTFINDFFLAQLWKRFLCSCKSVFPKLCVANKIYCVVKSVLKRPIFKIWGSNFDYVEDLADLELVKQYLIAKIKISRQVGRCVAKFLVLA